MMSFLQKNCLVNKELIKHPKRPADMVYSLGIFLILLNSKLPPKIVFTLHFDRFYLTTSATDNIELSFL